MKDVTEVGLIITSAALFTNYIEEMKKRKTAPSIEGSNLLNLQNIAI